MKKLLLLLVFLCFADGIFAQTYSYETLSVSANEKVTNTCYTFQKLRLYPIRARASFQSSPYAVGKYTHLAEALAGKKIVISEVENLPTNHTAPNSRQPANTDSINTRSRGLMNTLWIENTSADTLYLMAGEIVEGGKQDRVLAQDLILPPMHQQSIKVFCVEQGRWQYNPTDTTKKIQTYYGIAPLHLRKRVEKDQNQQAVWSEVRRANNENNIQTPTESYTAQKNSPYLQHHTQVYLAYFEKAFSTENQVIGVLVVSGDKVLGCDMFASTALFQAQFKHLLPAYIHDALIYGTEVQIEAKIVQTYLDNLLKDEKNQQIFLKQRGKVFEYQNQKLHISTF